MMQFFKSSTKETMNFLRYIGPGLLVTVGFIDPGNWASNIAAGSGYGNAGTGGFGGFGGNGGFKGGT